MKKIILTNWFILAFSVFAPVYVAPAQSVYEKSLVVIAHDHRFSDSSFDGKNDFKEMINAGVTAKVICLVTDIQDWKDGKVVRLESDSAIQSQFGYGSWQAFYEGRVRELLEKAKQRNSDILIIKKAKDFIEAKKKKKAGIVFGTEGVKFLNASTQNLETYYKQGLRHIQIYREPVAFGAAVDEKGLTVFGKELIKKCNALGIAIDVTHIQNLQNATAILNEITTLSTQPVICSHQHSKTDGGLLSDEQIKIIAASGNGKGVIGIHFISNYVNPLEISSLVKIIKHIKSLVGIEHVALGADYSPTAAYKWAIQDVSGLNLLAKAMLEDGFNNDEVEKVLGENLYLYYDNVWSKKSKTRRQSSK